MLKRSTLPTSLCCLFLTVLTQPVLARTSLGIGVAEEAPPQIGPLGWFFGHIHVWQQAFEQTMSNSLIAVNSNPSAGFFLIAISFIYGILHAVGPGHGKAVISSYLIANDETLKRGIVLSFASSLLQAMSAIIIVLAVFYFLPIRWTTAAYWLTTASFALVTLLGFWMLAKTTPRLFYKNRQDSKIEKAANELNWQPRENRDFTIKHFASPPAAILNKPTLLYKSPNSQHEFRGGGALCADCGTAHIADPSLLSGRLNMSKAISAVLSVGLRPCSGALLVMSFAAVNNLYYEGLISVFAMSLGTFITVSILAMIAVKVKTLALRIMKREQSDWKVAAWFEWLAAAVIFVLGLSLVISSLISLP